MAQYWISETFFENGCLYCTKVHHRDQAKTLYTMADGVEEAGQKFHRHLICQWVGYPFDSPETLLEGVFDKLEDGAYRVSRSNLTDSKTVG